jgi:hypothetical protein
METIYLGRRSGGQEEKGGDNARVRVRAARRKLNT